VRDLARAETLKWAFVAAAVSAALCFPRVLLWQGAPLPVWRLESILFLGSVVLWAFVFAWHHKYSGRPAFVLRPGWLPFIAATLAGLLCAAGRRLLLDPALRTLIPGYCPATGTEWVAMLCFSLGFAQVMLLFAPYAWSARLLRSPGLAAGVTVLFGAFVLTLKVDSQEIALPTPLFAALVLDRIIAGSLAVLLYLRGGILLPSWMLFLAEVRLLPAWNG